MKKDPGAAWGSIENDPEMVRLERAHPGITSFVRQRFMAGLGKTAYWKGLTPEQKKAAIEPVIGRSVTPARQTPGETFAGAMAGDLAGGAAMRGAAALAGEDYDPTLAPGNPGQAFMPQRPPVAEGDILGGIRRGFEGLGDQIGAVGEAAGAIASSPGEYLGGSYAGEGATHMAAQVAGQAPGAVLSGVGSAAAGAAALARGMGVAGGVGAGALADYLYGDLSARGAGMSNEEAIGAGVAGAAPGAAFGGAGALAARRGPAPRPVAPGGVPSVNLLPSSPGVALTPAQARAKRAGQLMGIPEMPAEWMGDPYRSGAAAPSADEVMAQMRAAEGATYGPAMPPREGGPGFVAPAPRAATADVPPDWSGLGPRELDDIMSPYQHALIGDATEGAWPKPQPPREASLEAALRAQVGMLLPGATEPGWMANVRAEAERAAGRIDTPPPVTASIPEGVSPAGIDTRALVEILRGQPEVPPMPARVGPEVPRMAAPGPSDADAVISPDRALFAQPDTFSGPVNAGAARAAALLGLPQESLGAVSGPRAAWREAGPTRSTVGFPGDDVRTGAAFPGDVVTSPAEVPGFRAPVVPEGMGAMRTRKERVERLIGINDTAATDKYGAPGGYLRGLDDQAWLEPPMRADERGALNVLDRRALDDVARRIGMDEAQGRAAIDDVLARRGLDDVMRRRRADVGSIGDIDPRGGPVELLPPPDLSRVYDVAEAEGGLMGGVRSKLGALLADEGGALNLGALRDAAFDIINAAADVARAPAMGARRASGDMLDPLTGELAAGRRATSGLHQRIAEAIADPEESPTLRAFLHATTGDYAQMTDYQMKRAASKAVAAAFKERVRGFIDATEQMSPARRAMAYERVENPLFAADRTPLERDIADLFNDMTDAGLAAGVIEQAQADLWRGRYAPRVNLQDVNPVRAVWQKGKLSTEGLDVRDIVAANVEALRAAWGPGGGAGGGVRKLKGMDSRGKTITTSAEHAAQLESGVYDVRKRTTRRGETLYDLYDPSGREVVKGVTRRELPDWTAGAAQYVDTPTLPGVYAGGWRRVWTSPDGNRVRLMRDWTDAERVMWEVQDITAALAKGYQTMASAIESSALYDAIASDPAMALTPDRAPPGWVEMGTKTSKGANTYGALNGMAVRPDVASAIAWDMGRSAFWRASGLMKGVKKLTDASKKSLTVWRPAGHVLQGISAIANLEMNGGTVLDIPMAASMMANGDRTVRVMLESGGLHSGADVAALPSVPESIANMQHLTPRPGMAWDIMDAIVQGAKKMDDAATAAYGVPDNLARVAWVYRKAKEYGDLTGQPVDDAVIRQLSQEARYRFYGGDMSTPLADVLSDTGAELFAKFAVWSTMNLGRTLAENPMGLAKQAAVATALSVAAASLYEGKMPQDLDWESVVARNEGFPSYDRSRLDDIANKPNTKSMVIGKDALGQAVALRLGGAQPVQIPGDKVRAGSAIGLQTALAGAGAPEEITAMAGDAIPYRFELGGPMGVVAQAALGVDAQSGERINANTPEGARHFGGKFIETVLPQPFGKGGREIANAFRDQPQPGGKMMTRGMAVARMLGAPIDVYSPRRVDDRDKRETDDKIRAAQDHIKESQRNGVAPSQADIDTVARERRGFLQRHARRLLIPEMHR